MHSEPERRLQAWLGDAVHHGGGAFPEAAMRFLVAPARVLLAGVWLPSHRSFPLVLTTRVIAPARALPWPLHLASYAGWLDAAESCLLLARRGEVEPAWRFARQLTPPPVADLHTLEREAERVCDELATSEFAARTLDRSRDGGTRFARAVRAVARDPVLDLPAHDETDLFAWLTLVRAQRGPGTPPHAIFWARARGRALIAVDAPDPTLLRRFEQPAAAPFAEPSAYERARNEPLLVDRTLGDLARALACGLTALPLEAVIDMPPPLLGGACYTRLHGVLETK